ncbi:hypothetical protein ACFL6H_07125 [Candidatus Latescibacterota bacterium]
MKKENLIVIPCLILLILFYRLDTSSADSTSNFYWGKSKTSEKYDFGVEYSTLEQINFDFLGINSYTFIIGKQFQKETRKNWGWRYMLVNVPLSSDYLLDENRAHGITGNRSKLSGKIHHQRLYLDYYPPAAHFFYTSSFDTHVLRVELIPGFGIGYSNWYLHNFVDNKSYDLRALTFGGNLRIKTVFFDLFFIEYPFMDFSFLALKNHKVKATIGDITIDRSEYFSFNTFINMGIRFEF